MGKLHKALLIIFIILLLGFNITLAVNSYYSYTFSEAIIMIVKSLIPLAILLIYYFVAARHIEKLSINYVFLLISLLSFIIPVIVNILYYSLIIDRIYKFLYVFYLFSILFLIAAFLNNSVGKLKRIWHFKIIVIAIVILQLYFSFDYLFVTYTGPRYTNPDRYELVRHHYFSEEEFSYLPDQIPNDAMNIKFRCEPEGSYDTKKSLHLEYDSPSVPNDNHHAYFNIVIF